MTIQALTAETPPTDSPQKVHDAARQFEALLLSEMLKNARETSSEDEDQTTASIKEMSEQQLAGAMAAGGGLGLAKLVVQGIKTSQDRIQLREDPYPTQRISGGGKPLRGDGL